MTAPGPELVAYVETIEGYLGRLRGRELSLSPRDVGLARRLHSAGVPLANVMAAIDRAREAAGPAVSLAFAARFLRNPARPRPDGTGRGPAQALAAGPARVETPNLEALIAALTREEWRGDVFVERLTAQARELVEEGRAGDLAAGLQSLDAAVDAWLAGRLSAKELQACRLELRRSLARAVSHVAAREEAVRREAVRRARERLRLPRLV
jgi:hypothetical protein